MFRWWQHARERGRRQGWWLFNMRESNIELGWGLGGGFCNIRCKEVPIQFGGASSEVRCCSKLTL